MILMNVIKSSPLFMELYDDEIESIIKGCSVKVVEAGEYIFREKDEGKEIFLMLTGKIVVCKGEMILGTLEKGDLFGELVLVNEQKRTADSLAKTYSEVLVIHYDAIFGTYSKRPRIFAILMTNIARLLARRLQRTNAEMGELYEFMNKAS